jgi:hypothetical protein
MSMHTVSKNQFIQVLQNYLSTSPDDAREIKALAEEFPYSQVLRVLWARLSKDHGFPEHQAALQKAAVYAGDRSVLKEIITRTAPAWPVSHEQEGIEHPETPHSISTSERTETEETGMAEKVIHDLERLSAARHHFESLFETPSESADDSSSYDSDSAEDSPDGGAKKSKKQRIIELVKALEDESSDDPDQSNGTENGEDITSEIKSSKKK